MLTRKLLLVSLIALLSACGGSSSDQLIQLPGTGGSDGNLGGGAPGTGGGTTTPPPVVNDTIQVTAAVAATGLAYHYQIPWPALTGTVTYKAVSLPVWAHIDATGAVVGTPDSTDATAQLTFQVVAQGDNKTITANGSMVVNYAAKYKSNTAIDFYNTPLDGHARQYRNDLTGSLQGQVSIVQTHSVAPEHDENLLINKADETKSHYRPDIIALREALLLFMPATGTDPVTVSVQVNAPGKAPITLAMLPPNDLPARPTRPRN